MGWRCRQPILQGERWHFGHVDVPGAKASGAYAGPEHALRSQTSGGWARQGVRRDDAPLPPNRCAQPKARARSTSTRVVDSGAPQHYSEAQLSNAAAVQRDRRRVPVVTRIGLVSV
jgi:hypothetical protein